ncbi:MAG: bifunctional 5,10-methylenetetrahydrofolate dehydrogenase/5,10-methenyltetrahydrofolate cyclohydrolase [Rectinemataceae bacterium]
MSHVLKGSEVVAALKANLLAEIEKLSRKSIVPTLAIVRIGARPDDLAYERGTTKKMESLGIGLKVFELPESIGQRDFETAFAAVNDDPLVHGILLFRPLPKHLDEEAAKRAIVPMKDVDCMGAVNIAKLFSGDDTGFAPCTPEAVMALLEHFGIGLEGKRVVMLGRSMVVGKPLSMLLLKKNATVTICHSKTKDLAETCREADILIAAMGRAKMITADYVSDESVVIDVGINTDSGGALCGDVDFDALASKVDSITPVPGGVGAVTSTVLAEHVVRAAAAPE